MAKKAAKPIKKPASKPASTKPKPASAKPKPAATPVQTATPAPSAPVKLPANFIKALNRYLGHLNDEALLADAIAYITGGESAEVLLRIGANADAGKSLALAGVSNNVAYGLRQALAAERLKVYREGVDAPPAVWVRFGEVLDTAARASGRKGHPVSGWPDWLTALTSELLVGFYDGGRSEAAVWPVQRLVPIFAEAKLPASEAIRLLFDGYLQSSLRMGSYYGYGNPNGALSGWPEFFAGNLPALREAIAKLGMSYKTSALRTLAELKFDFTPMIDLIAELASSSTKALRDTTLPILHKHSAVALPHIEKTLAEGSSSQRNEAATLLWKLDGGKAVDKLRKHLKNESSEKVQQTIEKLLAVPVGPDENEASEALALPPLKLELGEIALPGEARVRLRKVFEKAHELQMRTYEQELARFNGPNKPSWMQKPTKPEPLTERQLDELCAFVSGARTTPPPRDVYRRHGLWNITVCDESFAPPGVHLIHVVRLSYMLYRFDLERADQHFYWGDTSDLDAYRSRCEQPFGLRELDAAVASLPNGKPGMVTFAYLQNNNKYREFCDWEPEAIWPAFAEQLDLLRESVAGVTKTGQHDYYIPERRRNAFKVLSTFPKLPPGFVPLLWDMALGDAKTDRAPAQAALKSLPNKAARVAVGLTNGRQTIREAAAEWLGNIGDKSAIPALKEAFRKEKAEVTKGIIMVALEKLQADVSEFLDRKKLLKEAEEGLKKPPKVYGIELDKLPAVHWQDTNKPVDSKIVQWWVIQAAAQGSAACGPILRRYLAMCRPLDTAALARYVLTGWLERPGQKGLLAIVSAAGDADCVRMSEKYIRTWFGQKMSQCKSLIEILAWIKHPMALQVLLSIANRFRTASLRTLAASLVTAIAEREGWTIDELADRTIPDGGFAKPEGGGRPTLVLDYGPRQFTATLDDELEPVLMGEGGKVVKALPPPAKADDPEKAKEAKKAFSDAKKQIKDVVKRQRERLYEALCTQRAWMFSDWKQFLSDHPIVGRICVRVAWSASEPAKEQTAPRSEPAERPSEAGGAEGKFLGCFRPLEDGSLTNEKDDAVTFPPDTLIRIAHTANTPAELAAAWKQHFTDYNVEPIFDQFGRASFVLPESKAKETAITDFRGYEIGTYQIRGKLTKLGYVRGEPGDGGWFHDYVKPFRSLGIQAEIEFSGNSLPEEDRRAALGTLKFVKIKPDGETAGGRWNAKALELGKVPPVLLSECYNDLKQLAAEGTGFNPEWEKNSYY